MYVLSSRIKEFILFAIDVISGTIEYVIPNIVSFIDFVSRKPSELSVQRNWDISFLVFKWSNKLCHKNFKCFGWISSLIFFSKIYFYYYLLYKNSKSIIIKMYISLYIALYSGSFFLDCGAHAKRLLRWTNFSKNGL